MINSLVRYWPEGDTKDVLAQIVGDNGLHGLDLIDRFGNAYYSVPATEVDILSVGPPGLFKLGVKWNG
jgi:hypothetical protein